MLPGLAPSVMGGPPALEYCAHAEIEGPASSFNFTSVNIGTPEESRLVLVFTTYGRNGSADFSSCTIGGVAATKIGECDGSNVGLALFAAIVPTNTSVTVAVSLSASSRCGIEVFALHNYRSATPVSSSFPGGGGRAVRTVTLSEVSEGIVLLGSTAGENCGDWTGAGTGTTHKDSNVTASSYGDSVGHQVSLADAAGSVFTCASPGARVVCGAVWR